MREKEVGGEREGEREREIQTERKGERDRQRQRGREGYRQRGRERETETHRETQRESNEWQMRQLKSSARAHVPQGTAGSIWRLSVQAGSGIRWQIAGHIVSQEDGLVLHVVRKTALETRTIGMIGCR